ncbi:MAG: hypothetical protein ACKVU1_01330 [bacterium]
MTMSNIFLVVAALVVGVVGFYLARMLAQLTKTLTRVDTTLTEIDQVLGHAERVVAMADTQVRAVASGLTELQHRARSMGASIDRFRQGIAQPLATTASVLGFVTNALGITSKSKGGNHHV